MRGLFVGSGRYEESGYVDTYWQSPLSYEVALTFDEIRQKFGFPEGSVRS